MTFHLSRSRTGLAAAAVASLALAGIASGTSYATGSSAPPSTHQASARASSYVASLADPYVDVTQRSGPAATTALRLASDRAQTRATRDFRASQSDSTVLELSGTTGTVRYLADLDGYLTARSSRSPQTVALGYVRAHAAALGLTRADVRTLHLHRDYRDIAGVHHLFFTQRIGGHTLARTGLIASVTRGGRLLTLGGMPVSRATSRSLPAASELTITSGAQALALAGGTSAAGDDSAERIVFDTGTELRPAWETVVTSSATPATTVTDAVTGETLLRTPLTHYEHSTGRVFRFFPGARRGGRQVGVDFTAHGWLSAHATTLRGNNSHTYSDVDDNDRPSRSEEVHQLRGQSWGYHLRPFDLGFARSFCGKPWPCSWNPNQAYSWRVNRAQNATQVFYFVNNWHDHLQRAPIGFTEAAGNFQLVNHGRHGVGGDPVMTQTDDGADTGHGKLRGLPDPDHIDNANMSTPPDGHRPKMQMFLQHAPFTAYPGGDPWSPTNVGDEADTVYHEYTHGLSSRLVVDVRGRSALGPVQGDAMGEAWSDWYAMDYLVAHGLERDRSGRADVRLSAYDGAGADEDRTEAMDCKVGQLATNCGGGHTGHRGGYTYADFGQVIGEPEVHADGEIWGQTLWDLRDRLGSRRSESLVTRAMELAPLDPSFLDLRNAILVADTAADSGHDHTAIWRVFAHRGMGFYAGSFGETDPEPAASFAMPPGQIETGTIAGTVTDARSGKPLAGIAVTLAFQGAGVVNPTAITDAAGHYVIAGIRQGSYGKLAVRGSHYRSQRPVTVGAGTTTESFSTHHD
jgi:extracellular elastinolytic metalloproteinase